MFIGDGGILPSYLKLRSEDMDAADHSYSNMYLRVGRVIKVHIPQDKTNVNKKYFEYDVEVQVKAGISEVYPRCVMADPLGGMADSLEWTPRIAKNLDPSNEGPDEGTWVLVLCVNGMTSRALIVGGFKHPERKKPDSKEDGHHLTFEFNGIRMNINKDGDLQITHRGATNSDGTVIDNDSSKNGTSILLDKNGDVKVGTGDNNRNLIHLDSQGKSINIHATEGVVNVKAASNVKIESMGVLTGSASDSTMMGTTYRTAEQVMHSTVTPLLTSLSAQLAAAGASIAAASGQFIAASAAMKVPVAGAIAASVPIQTGATTLATAGATITSMGPIVAQIMAAIQAFEAQSISYLSLKNKSD